MLFSKKQNQIPAIETGWSKRNLFYFAAYHTLTHTRTWAVRGKEDQTLLRDYGLRKDSDAVQIRVWLTNRLCSFMFLKTHQLPISFPSALHEVLKEGTLITWHDEIPDSLSPGSKKSSPSKIVKKVGVNNLFNCSLLISSSPWLTNPWSICRQRTKIGILVSCHYPSSPHNTVLMILFALSSDQWTTRMMTTTTKHA
jgi:hypothetical protein